MLSNECVKKFAEFKLKHSTELLGYVYETSKCILYAFNLSAYFLSFGNRKISDTSVTASLTE